MGKPVILADSHAKTINHTRLKCVGGSDVEAGTLIKSATGGFDAAVDGDAIIGFSYEDVTAGQVGNVVLFTPSAECWVDLEAGFSPNFMDPFAVASGKTVDAGTSSDPVAGYIIGKEPGSSTRARALFVSGLFSTATI